MEQANTCQQRGSLWRYVRIATATVFLLLLVVGGLWITPDRTTDLSSTLQEPSLTNVMGTDHLGRDVFGRVLEGSARSLVIALAAWLAALALGVVLGTVAGYFSRSPADWVISRLIDLAYVTPFMIFLIAILSITGPGLISAYLVLVLFAWAPPARQTRAYVRSLREAPHVTATQSLGYGTIKVFSRAIMPIAYRPAFLASIAFLPEIIALDAALSFFGLGPPPPEPTLGNIIAEGINYLSSAWWIAAFPVIALSLACLTTRAIANDLSETILP